MPRAAAEDFLYGHIKVPLGIVFERADFPLSDGAKLIAEFGRQPHPAARLEAGVRARERARSS